MFSSSALFYKKALGGVNSTKGSQRRTSLVAMSIQGHSWHQRKQKASSWPKLSTPTPSTGSLKATLFSSQ
jgi:hypothetical protein